MNSGSFWQHPLGLLDIGAKGVAVLAPIALVCAVTYDYVFWIVIDPDMLGLMTLSDHVASAVSEIPIFVFATFTLFVVLGLSKLIVGGDPIDVVRRKIRDRSTADPNTPSSADIRRANRAVSILIVLIGIIAGIGAVFVPQASVSALLIFFATGLLLLAAFRAHLSSPGLFLGRDAGLHLLVILATFMIFILAGFAGAVAGISTKYGRHSGPEVVQLSGGEVIERAVAVRSFAQGLFVFDLNGLKPRFILWAEVKEVRSR